MKIAELEGLRPYAATAVQERYLEAVIEAEGSPTKAAELLGTSRGTVRSAIAKVQRHAARAGHAPGQDMTHTVPPGYHVKGVSTMYDGDGNIRAQWVKSQASAEERTQMLLEAIGDVLEDYRGLSEIVPPPEYAAEDLLNVIPLGDPHLGMMAHGEECGENFDLKIAEKNLYTAVDRIAHLAPHAAVSLLLNLGDFFHADNQLNVTPKSGHHLDVDGRKHKILRVGVRLMIRLVYRLLEKSGKVIVQCLIGNHDTETAYAMSLMLSLYFENNPRVEVDLSPSVFRYMKFGNTLIGMHHGHSGKAKDLPMIMAADRPEWWGETKHRRWYCGHVHHDTRTKDLAEYGGVIVETFRTLAPRDSWHHSQGYRSGRDLKLDVIHRVKGQVNRHIVGIDEVMELQGEQDGDSGGES